MLIKYTNSEKIEKIIKEAEGRATARTIDYGSMSMAIDRLEESLGIPKKHMIGIVADIDVNAQDFPRAYKYTPESTHFRVIRKQSGWDLERVYRDRTRRYNHEFHVTLTEQAKEAIIESKSSF